MNKDLFGTDFDDFDMNLFIDNSKYHQLVRELTKKHNPMIINQILVELLAINNKNLKQYTNPFEQFNDISPPEKYFNNYNSQKRVNREPIHPSEIYNIKNPVPIDNISHNSYNGNISYSNYDKNINGDINKKLDRVSELYNRVKSKK